MQNAVVPGTKVEGVDYSMASRRFILRESADDTDYLAWLGALRELNVFAKRFQEHHRKHGRPQC